MDYGVRKEIKATQQIHQTQRVYQKQYWWHKAHLVHQAYFMILGMQGNPFSERTVNRVLQQSGLRNKAARKFKYNIDTSHHHIVPNMLDRQFNPDKPNTTWVTDITYIKRGEDWLYLLVIIAL